MGKVHDELKNFFKSGAWTGGVEKSRSHGSITEQGGLEFEPATPVCRRPGRQGGGVGFAVGWLGVHPTGGWGPLGVHARGAALKSQSGRPSL